MSDVVYVAYQSDVFDYMALEVTDEADSIDFDLVSLKIKSTMQACLVGWWDREASELNKTIAELSNWRGSFIADRSGFVVRVANERWRAFEVEFVSDRLDEAIVTELPSTGECPIPLPESFIKIISLE